MTEDRLFKEKVRVTFRRRDDGGLQAFCEGVPGFYLSGLNPRDVMHDVVPTIELLFKHNVGIDVEVFPLQYAMYQLHERPAALDSASQSPIPDEREYLIERKLAA